MFVSGLLDFRYIRHIQEHKNIKSFEASIAIWCVKSCFKMGEKEFSKETRITKFSKSVQNETYNYHRQDSELQHPRPWLRIFFHTMKFSFQSGKVRARIDRVYSNQFIRNRIPIKWPNTISQPTAVISSNSRS